jgi:hypothetical protein
MSIWDELKSLVTPGPIAESSAPAVVDAAAQDVAPAQVIAVPAKAQAVELDDAGENPRRPIDWAEEQRTDLPQRTRQRIRFLLMHETERQTKARIENDRARFLCRKPVINFDKKPNTNPQAHLSDPTAPVSSVGLWRV